MPATNGPDLYWETWKPDPPTTTHVTITLSLAAITYLRELVGIDDGANCHPDIAAELAEVLGS